MESRASTFGWRDVSEQAGARVFFGSMISSVKRDPLQLGRLDRSRYNPQNELLGVFGYSTLWGLNPKRKGAKNGGFGRNNKVKISFFPWRIRPSCAVRGRSW